MSTHDPKWQAPGAELAAIGSIITPSPNVLDLTDFKRDLSELTDRLGHAQHCL